MVLINVLRQTSHILYIYMCEMKVRKVISKWKSTNKDIEKRKKRKGRFKKIKEKFLIFLTAVLQVHVYFAFSFLGYNIISFFP